MNAQELQSLRNLGNECEEAADEIERLRAQQAMLMAAHEFVKQERDAWYDENKTAEPYDAWQAATLAERERCAKLFDTTLNGEAEHYWREAAAAIRNQK